MLFPSRLRTVHYCNAASLLPFLLRFCHPCGGGGGSEGGLGPFITGTEEPRADTGPSGFLRPSAGGRPHPRTDPRPPACTSPAKRWSRRAGSADSGGIPHGEKMPLSPFNGLALASGARRGLGARLLGRRAPPPPPPPPPGHEALAPSGGSAYLRDLFHLLSSAGPVGTAVRAAKASKRARNANQEAKAAAGSGVSPAMSSLLPDAPFQAGRGIPQPAAATPLPPLRLGAAAPGVLISTACRRLPHYRSASRLSAGPHMQMGAAAEPAAIEAGAGGGCGGATREEGRGGTVSVGSRWPCRESPVGGANPCGANSVGGRRGGAAPPLSAARETLELAPKRCLPMPQGRGQLPSLATGCGWILPDPVTAEPPRSRREGGRPLPVPGP